MKFEDEKEIENMLVLHHKEFGVCRVLDEQFDYYEQQVRLEGYGIIDILAMSVLYEDRKVDININILELKQGKIKSVDVAQIATYFTGLSRLIENVYGYNKLTNNMYTRMFGKTVFEITVNCHLVGSGYSFSEKNEVCFLVDAIDWLSCHHYDISFDGVDFKESCDWYRENESKKEPKIKNLNIKEIVLGSVKRDIKLANYLSKKNNE